MKKKFTPLSYPGSSNLPLPTSGDVSPKCSIIKDSSWEEADEPPIDAVPPLEHVKNEEAEVEVYIYETLFKLHGEGTVIDPRLILRMRVERAEVP